MMTPEERELVTDIADKLLDLYVQRDGAEAEGDLECVNRLQAEIQLVSAERSQILHRVEDG
jgi:hypothetical protein